MTRIKHGLNDLRQAFFKNALWLASIGIMLASSGIDGTYMAAWMPKGAEVLGYILNTVADISGMALTFYYGVLIRESARGSKRHKLARVLLGGELVSVFYQWFFSWRQLLRVLPAVEPVAFGWVAPVAALFNPLLLAFIGLAQSLLYEPESDTQLAPAETKLAPQPAKLARGKNATAASDAQVALQPAQVAPSPETQVQLTPQPGESDVKVSPAEMQPPQLSARQLQLAALLRESPDATKTQLAAALQVSRTTVAADMKALQLAGRR